MTITATITNEELKKMEQETWEHFTNSLEMIEMFKEDIKLLASERERDFNAHIDDIVDSIARLKTYDKFDENSFSSNVEPERVVGIIKDGGTYDIYRVKGEE